jgi:hypothetical protein
MPASASAHCPVSAARAPAHRSSRRILRGIVSPSSRSVTTHDRPSTSCSVPPSSATTVGTGTPALAAARTSRTSVPMPAA